MVYEYVYTPGYLYSLYLDHGFGRRAALPVYSKIVLGEKCGKVPLKRDHLKMIATINRGEPPLASSPDFK